MSFVSGACAPLVLHFRTDQAAIAAALEAARELGHYEFPDGAALEITSERGDVIATIPLVRLHS
jgi:hypothetical protein